MAKASDTLTVINRYGLHARPAVEFVRLARTFRSAIYIVKNEARFAATSIMEVLTANLDCGSTFELEAEGPDAEEAVKGLKLLLKNIKDTD